MFLHLYQRIQEMFSKTCEYAVRALIFVAQKSKDGSKIGIKDISKGIHSPEYFIAKILQELSRKGFVESIKGPNGGFYLENNQLKISIADIVRAMDGDKLFSGCGLGLKVCSEKHPCPIHNEFKHIRENITVMLENSTLEMYLDSVEFRLTSFVNDKLKIV